MKRLTLITFILGTALAIAPAASAMVMSDGSSSSTSVVPSVGIDPATQATLLRSEELAKFYGAPATKAVQLRSEELAKYYGAPATKAVELRSAELAKYYGASSTSEVRDGWMSSVTSQASPVILHTDVLGGDGGATAVQVPALSADDSFDWGSAGIGAVTLTGVMLLAVGFVTATRRRHQLGF